MKLSRSLSFYFVMIFFAAGLAVIVWQIVFPEKRSVLVDVTVPKLSQAALEGKMAFDRVCAACHGANAAGSDTGPPLVHAIYNPGHHADFAFVLAARRGVRAHHWKFGDMPPQPDISEAEIAAIVHYVRELQAANGIQYQPHKM